MVATYCISGFSHSNMFVNPLKVLQYFYCVSIYILYNMSVYLLCQWVVFMIMSYTVFFQNLV